jgi:ribosomal protein S21
MKKFEVCVEEVVVRTYVVEANNKEDALKKYKRGSIVDNYVINSKLRSVSKNPSSIYNQIQLPQEHYNFKHLV